MNGWFVLAFVCGSFVLIALSKGAYMSLMYLGLSIGLSIAAIFFTLAFRVWMGK